MSPQKIGHDGLPTSPPFPAASGEAYFKAASAALTELPSTFEATLLAELLARHYGLSGQIETLSSEVEHTAEVTLADGARLILKTARQPEAVPSFRFQSAALGALEGAKGFIAPRLLRTLDGAAMFEDAGVSGYLQTRLDGSLLHRETRTPDLLRRTGRALGALDRALAGHDLPAADRPVLWHIGCWPRLTRLESHLPPGPVAQAVERALARYVDRIEPALGELAWQVAHNDPSPFNTLASDEDIAFIDFGDGVFGPRIQDLAIAASHLVADPAFPLGGAEHLIAGYHSVLPLSALETRHLVGLMAARQSALILINHWRADLFPADAAYIKKNVGRAEAGLVVLDRLSPSEGEAAVRAALGS